MYFAFLSKEERGRLNSADQEYRVRNMNTMEQKTEISMFPVALTCTHALSSLPCSVTWQLLRKQTESQRSVNDAEVLLNPPVRGSGSGALSCPAHPRDARRMLAFLTGSRTLLSSEYTTNRRPVRARVQSCCRSVRLHSCRL